MNPRILHPCSCNQCRGALFQYPNAIARHARLYPPPPALVSTPPNNATASGFIETAVTGSLPPAAPADNVPTDHGFAPTPHQQGPEGLYYTNDEGIEVRRFTEDFLPALSEDEVPFSDGEGDLDGEASTDGEYPETWSHLLPAWLQGTDFARRAHPSCLCVFLALLWTS
jgi:hypothetical protein